MTKKRKANEEEGRDESERSSVGLLDLSDDVLKKILSYLHQDIRSLGSCEMTCRHLFTVVQESWSILDSRASEDLRWNECGNYAGDEANTRAARRYRAIRYVKAIKLADRMDELMATHLGPSVNEDGNRIWEPHKCPGCDYPSRLELDWVKNPRDYEYFVRIAIFDGGLPARPPVSRTFLFQGFFPCASTSFDPEDFPPTLQLNIDLRDEQNGDDTLPDLRAALDCQVHNDRLQSPRWDCKVVTTVLSVHKEDLKVGLMYATNHLRKISSTPQSFTLVMSDIYSKDTHLSSRRDSSEANPTTTHGELSNMATEISPYGRWQMRVACETMDRAVYNPDRGAMRDFYWPFYVLDAQNEEVGNDLNQDNEIIDIDF